MWRKCKVFRGHRFSIKSLLQLSLVHTDRGGVIIGATCGPVPIKLGDFWATFGVGATFWLSFRISSFQHFRMPSDHLLSLVTKCYSSFNYKVRLSVFTKDNSFFFLLQGATSDITKCDRFSKVRRLMKIVTKHPFKHLFNFFLKLNNMSYVHHPRK